MKNVIVFFHGWDDRFVRRVSRNPIFRFLMLNTFAKAAVIVVLAEIFMQQLAMSSRYCFFQGS